MSTSELDVDAALLAAAQVHLRLRSPRETAVVPLVEITAVLDRDTPADPADLAHDPLPRSRAPCQSRRVHDLGDDPGVDQRPPEFTGLDAPASERRHVRATR